MLSLQVDDFELFGLPRQFEQDRDDLDARWKSLQREAHPDKFAAHGAASQRLAMQWSVRINEAYHRLKDPLRRATYLCQLQGHDILAESNTAMPASFLMQQMQWRETLDEATSAEDLDVLRTAVAVSERQGLQVLAQSIDHEQNFLRAVEQVRSLMFIQRFLHDIDARTDALEQG